MAENKLYVGNLPFQATEDDLKEVFGEHGVVTDARIITDRDSGRSRGFGFVEMQSDAEAAAAIKALDGGQLQGRALQVNVARPRTERRNEGGGGGGYRRESRW